MKKRLLFLFFLFCLSLVFSQVKAQTQCFKLYQPGTNNEITVICAGVPFEIKNCSSGFGSQDYYCLDSAAARRQDVLCFKENIPGTIFKFDSPGKYVITQLFIINGNRFPFEKRFSVKATPPPVFTATTCGQNKAEVTITDTNYDAYQVAINSGQPVSISWNTPTTIPTPIGSYTIYVTARYNTSSWCGTNSIGLTSPEAPANPVIQNLNVLGSVNSGKILFTLTNLKNGYAYHIEEQNSSGFQQKGILNFRSNTDTITIRNLDTKTARNYRVTMFDMCGKPQAFISNVVSSIKLNADAKNNKVVLTWLPYLNAAGRTIYYEIKRTAGMQGQETIFPDKLTGTSFEDNSAICGNTYCYELLVTENNKTFSQSNDSCVLVTSTLIPEGGFLVTTFLPDNTLSGTLTVPATATLKTLNIFKKQSKEPYAPFGQNQTNQFTDRNLNLTETNYCYKTTFTDNCGNISKESNESCPVILEADYNRNQRFLKLTWSKYQGFTGAPETYMLEISDGNGTVLTQKPVTGTFAYTDSELSNDNQILKYRIKVSTNKPEEISYSNTITIEQQATIFVPSAFSPNGDGLNDVFEVKGRFQNSFSFVILNRWGQVIFESKDPKKGWDGKISGTTAPIGVYVYKIKATDETNRNFDKTGTVTLVK